MDPDVGRDRPDTDTDTDTSHTARVCNLINPRLQHHTAAVEQENCLSRLTPRRYKRSLRSSKRHSRISPAIRRTPSSLATMQPVPARIPGSTIFTLGCLAVVRSLIVPSNITSLVSHAGWPATAEMALPFFTLGCVPRRACCPLPTSAWIIHVASTVPGRERQLSLPCRLAHVLTCGDSMR
jgi:hypothetical protein